MRAVVLTGRLKPSLHNESSRKWKHDFRSEHPRRRTRRSGSTTAHVAAGFALRRIVQQLPPAWASRNPAAAAAASASPRAKAITASRPRSTGGEQANSTGEPVAIQAASAPRTSRTLPARTSRQTAASSRTVTAAASTTGKRWKKKFRDRQRSGGSFENNGGSQNAGGSQNGHSSSNGGSNGGGFRSADTHQFGNNAGASSKRKGSFSSGGGSKQQRGPRSFVGPMDHSYRVVNGNFADAPPFDHREPRERQLPGPQPQPAPELPVRLAADRLLAGPRRSDRGRRSHEDRLLHRGPVFPREDLRDRPQARRQGRLHEERERSDRDPHIF